MTIAFVLGGLYLALGLAVLGGPRARGFLAVTAWPVALGISLVRRIRRARAMEPANSHPGRVIPLGVPILKALREVPDDREGNTAAPCGGRPSDHVPSPEAEEAVREVEKGPFRAMGDVLREVFRQIDEFREDERGTAPIPTGFPSLDRLIGGLRPGCLHVVAGRPSMGKTSFILGLAERVALAHRKRILLLSPGTSAVDLIHAMVCSHGRVNSFRLRTGRAEEEDLQNLAIAAGSLYLDRRGRGRRPPSLSRGLLRRRFPAEGRLRCDRGEERRRPDGDGGAPVPPRVHEVRRSGRRSRKPRAALNRRDMD